VICRCVWYTKTNLGNEEAKAHKGAIAPRKKNNVHQFSLLRIAHIGSETHPVSNIMSNRGFYLGFWPGRHIDHSLQSNSELIMRRVKSSTLPKCLHGVAVTHYLLRRLFFEAFVGSICSVVTRVVSLLTSNWVLYRLVIINSISMVNKSRRLWQQVQGENLGKFWLEKLKEDGKKFG